MEKTCGNCKYEDMKCFEIFNKTGKMCYHNEMWQPKNQIHGVGADMPTVTNEKGGKQSSLPYAFHLIDSKAIFALAHVLDEGAKKYERNNWRKIDAEEHCNHAVSHIYAYLAGDKQDEHLEHAFTRLMMAIGTQKESPLPQTESQEQNTQI